MQEHEFICEYEPGQGVEYNAESAPKQTGEKPQRLETMDESEADALTIDEQEELRFCRISARTGAWVASWWQR